MEGNKFIYFCELPKPEDKKTKCFEVRNVNAGIILGLVKWKVL